MNLTPLRYPGGKSVITHFLIELFRINDMHKIVYMEPYAGGAGAAINLLLNEFVDSIVINDANVCIYSFWKFLLSEPDSFLELFDRTEVTLDQWHTQNDIVSNAKERSLKLGFATFFLSRCNRSGILNAGPIGGRTSIKQENAQYKIDCRFNKPVLRNKLENIIKFKNRITVYNLDALTLLDRLKQDSNKLFVYLDPPYYRQGSRLYLNYYQHKDHATLAQYLKENSKFSWLLSYDDVPEIRALYQGFEQFQFTLNYSAQVAKKGYEFMTHSKDIKFPDSTKYLRNVNFGKFATIKPTEKGI